MRNSKRRRTIELLKDGLIVLLICSALWLAAQTQLLGPFRGLFREERTQASPGQSQSGERVGAALPMAMAVNLPGGEGPELPGGQGERYGVQYDQAACEALFRQVAGPLAETLSSAGTPRAVSREEWEQALTASLGIYMDFQGEMPISVLTNWLSGGVSRLDTVARKLVLTVQEEGVALYYRSEEDGGYYCCQSQVVDAQALAGTLSGMTGNGTFFAFESELYEALEPDTLLPAAAPAPGTYTASNPVTGGQGTLEEIVGDLGFSLNSTSFYSAGEQVARSGDDNVRLSDRGVLLYTAGEDSGRYPVADREGGGALTESVEACRQLAAAALLPRCGEARLYLISALPVPGGWDIDFGYSLNGLPVHLDGGSAASFQVRDGAVVQFVLRFRAYASAGAPSLVLPPRQAAAALAAKGLAGEELLLTYTDAGGDILSAGWSARDSGAGEG